MKRRNTLVWIIGAVLTVALALVLVFVIIPGGDPAVPEDSAQGDLLNEVELEDGRVPLAGPEEEGEETPAEPVKPAETDAPAAPTDEPAKEVPVMSAEQPKEEESPVTPEPAKEEDPDVTTEPEAPAVTPEPEEDPGVTPDPEAEPDVTPDPEGEPAEAIPVPALELVEPNRAIMTGEFFGVKISGLTGPAGIQLPAGLIFDEDRNLNDPAARNPGSLACTPGGRITITPAEAELYFIFLLAETEGRYELKLSDGRGETLKLNVTAAGQAAEDTEGEPAGEEPADEEPGEEEPADDEKPEWLDAVVVDITAAYASDRLRMGEKVTLTAEISGVPEDAAYTVQWQNNMDGEFKDIPGETELSVTFVADRQNTRCTWKLYLIPAEQE